MLLTRRFRLLSFCVVKSSNVAKVSIASSSPGIILATLGTLLIATSILTNHRIAVEDKSVYLHAYGSDSTFQMAIPNNQEQKVDPSSDDQKTLDEALN